MKPKLKNGETPFLPTKPMGALDILVVRALGDNWIYVIRTSAGAVVIDPGAAAPVERALARERLRLTAILVTHGHHDHTGGIAALKRTSGAMLHGPDGDRIPELDRVVREGDTMALGDSTISVLETPGHGAHDVSYLLHHPGRPDALFCGDTMFVSGCGRALAGSVTQLWNTLERLRRLPDATQVYCGHDYTEENLRFALSVTPGDPVYARRLEAVRAEARAGRVCVPSTFGIERRANPFLRCEDAESFARLRALKDRFGYVDTHVANLGIVVKSHAAAE